MKKVETNTDGNQYNHNMICTIAELILDLTASSGLNAEDLKITDSNNVSIEFDVIECNDEDIFFYHRGNRDRSFTVRGITKVNLVFRMDYWPFFGNASMMLPYSYIQIDTATGSLQIENSHYQEPHY